MWLFCTLSVTSLLQSAERRGHGDDRRGGTGSARQRAHPGGDDHAAEGRLGPAAQQQRRPQGLLRLQR